MIQLPTISMLLLLAGSVGKGEPQTQESFQISVNVNLVMLNATVRDRSGISVADLRQQDFEIHEDGVKQTIRLFKQEDTPVTVGLVVDHSGSMRHKLASVVAAARSFVQSSNPEDQMFVVNFNEMASLGLPQSMRLTNRVDDLTSAIANSPTEGMTALYDAVLLARNHLQDANRSKKVLIVISDGSDNASKHKLAEVVKMAQESTILVYAIGIFGEDDPDRNPDVLRRLTGITGGEAYFPKHLDEVVATCERIAHDIRSQYTIGYISTNLAQNAAYRTIRVTAKSPPNRKLTVRTRAGYIAGGAK